MELAAFALTIMAMTLGLVSLAVPVARWLGLPLSVVIAAAGLGIGYLTIDVSLEGAVGALQSDGVRVIREVALNPDVLLYIFLPPLLFEMALAVNVRRLTDDAASVFLMAVIAVVAATAFIGIAVWWASFLGIIACFLLGAATATTDPAAVVNTFREIGAPRRLQVIIEGESLLNDAAAIALFTVLISILRAGSGTTAEGFVFGFVYGFGMGAVVGLAIAYLTSLVFVWLGRSAAAETSMTVALAYGAYLVADALLGASGVVAVVFAGLYAASSGMVSVGPGQSGPVAMVWRQIGFWADNIILVLVTVMIPRLLTSLSVDEWILVPVIYAAAFAARGVILFGALPILGRFRLAAPMDAPQKVLVLWGGIRGAVTLLLALSLTEIKALGEDAEVLGALAAAFTLATLFINAATLSWAVKILRLDQLTPGDLALRERIVAGSIERVRSVISEIAAARTLEPEAVAAVEETLGRQRREAEDQSQNAPIAFGERLRLGLAILCGQESRLVRRAFEEGAIGPEPTRALRLVADVIGDAARVDGAEGYLRMSERVLSSASRYRLALFCYRHFKWDRLLRKRIELRLTTLLESERILRALDGFAAVTVAPMVGTDATDALRRILAQRLTRVQEEIASIALQYPQYTSAAERAFVARAAIRRERQQYERLFNDGVIGQELRDSLIQDLNRRERAAARPPRLDLTMAPAELIDRVALFRTLDAKQKQLVLRRLRTRFTVPGEVILRAGQRGGDVYVIVSGAFELRGDDAPVRLGNGEFFGELTLNSPQRRRRTSVVSLGFSRVLQLPQKDFQSLTVLDARLGMKIRQAALSSGTVPAENRRAALD